MLPADVPFGLQDSDGFNAGPTPKKIKTNYLVSVVILTLGHIFHMAPHTTLTYWL